MVCYDCSIIVGMTNLPQPRTRFKEPVVDSGADPYVIIHDDYFYYCHVIKDEAIYIRRAKTLDAIGTAEAVMVWRPPAGQEYSESLWAPELHHLDGKWYIYFAAGKQDKHYSNQRMYVIEGIGLDPLSAEYSFKGKITDTVDEWAIDGTILQLSNNDRYFVWSGRAVTDNLIQNLYIARMTNPWTLDGQRICIASPIYDWEKHGFGINEGPQILPQDSKRHIIYSASHSVTDYYCLGQITLVGGNPLDPTHWIKHPRPVFESHKGIIAPGHASFILTPDEAYGWMIFHAARSAGSAWDRQVRLRAFKILANGTPDFMQTAKLIDVAGTYSKVLKLLDKIVGKNHLLS